MISPLREVRMDYSAISSNVDNFGLDTVDVSCDAYGHGAVETIVGGYEGRCSRFVVRDEEELARLKPLEQEMRISVAISDAPPDGRAYGIGLAPELASRPMRVSARVVALKVVDTGDGVSYGLTWRAPAPTLLALVPLGYADGLTRSAGNRGSLWLGDAQRPIVGRVAMNVCVVDVGDHPVDVGDEAVLFGGRFGPSIDEWAASIGVPPLEVTSVIGAHVPRSLS